MFKKRINIVFLIILMCCMFPGCTESPKEPGRYYNKSKGFSIKFPDGWKKAQKQSGATVSMANPGQTASINIVVQKIPANITLKNYVKTTREKAPQIGAVIKKSGKTVIDGTDVYWAILSVHVGGQIFTSLNYDLMKKNRVYSILCTVVKDKISHHERVFRNVVRSFRFEPRPKVKKAKATRNKSTFSQALRNTIKGVSLGGIMYEPKGKSVAIINGSIVEEGDIIENYTVTSITKHAVFLKKDGRKFELTL